MTEPPNVPEQRDRERERDRDMPRGCNPFVFGIVAATIEMAILLYFMRSC